MFERIREFLGARGKLEEERKRTRRLRQRLKESREPPAVVHAFHRLYYKSAAHGKTWGATRWMGVPALKLPLDMWVYQEILFETRPDLIVETGTSDGGSALFLASVCDLLGSGRVLTVDITERGPSGKPRPEHPRIRYLHGSSTDEEIVCEIHAEAQSAGGNTLVVLDSDHSEGHVLAELRAYSALVPPGGYLIVEDTNVNGHPVNRRHGPGPAEAVEAFLPGSPFERDGSREKMLLTFNPGGYLKRTG